MPPTANINIELAKKVNVEGTKNLLSHISKTDPDIHLIFSSSVSVYGKNFENNLIDISSSINPDDNYAQTKYDSEFLVQESNIDATLLRISGSFNTYFSRTSIRVAFFYQINKLNLFIETML